ncbi:MAG: hypothetical protein IRY99_22460 [Isosphaeraceae bacterium]|nr:hypothetical protein [Isosphaeraceae bacterium]
MAAPSEPSVHWLRIEEARAVRERRKEAIILWAVRAIVAVAMGTCLWVHHRAGLYS